MSMFGRESGEAAGSGKPTVTALLVAWAHGDAQALEQLTPLVYDELCQLAHGYLRRESSQHTLETRALVHEAFLRLADQHHVSWKTRSHFYGIAALMMRRVLTEHARARGLARRGGGAVHLCLDSLAEPEPARSTEVLALEEALHRLGERHPEIGRIVDLRFFGGLSESEIAEVMAISVPTVKRRWRLARAWLHRDLTGFARDEPH